MGTCKKGIDLGLPGNCADWCTSDIREGCDENCPEPSDLEEGVVLDCGDEQPSRESPVALMEYMSREANEYPEFNGLVETAKRCDEIGDFDILKGPSPLTIAHASFRAVGVMPNQSEAMGQLVKLNCDDLVRGMGGFVMVLLKADYADDDWWGEHESDYEDMIHEALFRVSDKEAVRRGESILKSHPSPKVVTRNDVLDCMARIGETLVWVKCTGSMTVWADLIREAPALIRVWKRCPEVCWPRIRRDTGE